MVVLLAAARVAVLVGVILLVILEDQVAAAGDPGPDWLPFPLVDPR